MKYEVTEGPLQRAQRVLIYGPEGIGKSTMASQMPNPMFIDVESGTGHLYVFRMPTPIDWDMLLDECAAIVEDPGEVSTLVIDSADAAERLCQDAVCRRSKKPSIESWGYGKGYVIAAEEFQKLLDALDDCVRRGINVVMIAHSQMRKFERPDEAGAYDRFEVKLNKHIASKAKEWADAVLFLDYETFVSVDDNGKGKASGGKRVIRTSHNVSWDAKNRWGLPDKLPLNQQGIAKILESIPVRDGAETQQKAPAPATEGALPQTKRSDNSSSASDAGASASKPKTKAKPSGKQPISAPKKLRPLFEACTASGIRPEEVKDVMVAKGKRDNAQPITDWEGPFVEWLVKNWKRVTELVIEQRKTAKSKDETYDGDIPF